MTTQIFSISGMSCASCVNHIEKDVKKLSGVHHIAVNFAAEKAEIMFDPGVISSEKIIEQISKTGYKAEREEMIKETMHHEEHADHAGTEQESEIQSRLYKVLFGAFMSIIIIALGFFIEVPNEKFVMMIITFTILIYTGKDFYIRGIPSLLKGRPNMDTLVALGVSAAFLYSSANVLFLLKDEEYFMDSAIISTFIMLGRYLEAVAKGKANQAIKKLLGLSPKIAHQVTDQGIQDIPLDQLKKGDILLIKPGEKIPVDGKLTEGEATIDESMITGESIPIDKKKGDPLIGATINGNTSFQMKAEKIGKETMLAQIIRLVEQAQMSKAPIQKLVDMISEYFVWIVIAISIVTFGVQYFVTQDTSSAFIATVAVLIIACPCALGLATPISLVVGSGKGASLGILIKKAEALEKAHKLSTICFDKTGTITKGHPEVETFEALSDQNVRRALSLAKTLEEHSEHPIAKSIVDFCIKKNVPSLSMKNFQAITGKGVKGIIDEKTFSLGSVSYAESLKINPDPIKKRIEKLRSLGQTVLLLMDDENIIAIFGIRDGLKDTSKEAIALLHSKGIKSVMMTGDHRQIAEAIAKEVGIDEVLSEVTPQGKTKKIEELKKQGEFVGMVGDGINDSPALSASDIGIAMGTGSDIAIESGDIVLIKGDLMKAYEAIALSKATLKNIKQNLFWAFLYNTIGIPIAAFGFLNPIFSSLAMAFSSVSVVLNALRLKRFRIS